MSLRATQQHLYRHKDKDIPQHPSLQAAGSEDNQLQFIIRAQATVENGQIAEAENLLNDEVLEVVWQMLDGDQSQTNLILIVAAILWKTGRPKKAEQWYKKLLEWGPNAVAYDRLGSLYHYVGRMSEAVEYHRKAIETEPDKPELWANLARAMAETNQVQDGIDLLRKAVEKMPQNAQVHSNLLFRLHHLPELDPQMLFNEHSQWGRIHAPISRAKTNFNNIPEPDRRLRVGYISSAFRRNSVAYFFESILDGHDQQTVETYGYGNIEFSDQITECLKGKFDHYRDIRRLNDKAIAESIEQDRIDILVDLAGHTGDNCLTALAYKPAPIQVTYLGYPDTTGMKAIDYRLTDALAEPPGAQEFYTEKLIFLPDGFLCYRPADFAPTVAPLPADEKGYITFGSFNNNCKINATIAQLWSEILKSVKNSWLLLKLKGAEEKKIKDHYSCYLEQFGISPERLDICGWKSPAEHLQLYNEVDIALDAYPYNGTTTTCEALWMGVPVISLIGNKHHASRVGLSILTHVGLEFFAASTPAEYITKAVALAENQQSLAKIRSSMRARIAASGLCHAKSFARQLETAYRKMWRHWCQTQKPTPAVSNSDRAI